MDIKNNIFLKFVFDTLEGLRLKLRCRPSVSICHLYAAGRGHELTPWLLYM